MKSTLQRLIVIVVTALALTLASGRASAATIQVIIEELAHQDGIWIMRPWIALHDGNFQTFTVGQMASSGLRHIAEDGVSGDVSHPELLSGPPNDCVYGAGSPCQFEIFNAYAGGSAQLTIGGPTIPGARLVATFTNVNSQDARNRFLSFLIMLVPSNDAFFGTDSAHPVELYDGAGRFNRGHHGPIKIRVHRHDVYDAGTEVNTESHEDTAFFGQMVPGTGIHPDTNPVIHPHPGFGPNILHGSNIYPGSQLNFFSRANEGGDIAEITIQELP